MKTLFLALSFALVYLFTLIAAYKLLEKPSVYNNFFSGFMPTYENQNGNIMAVPKPFTAISEKALVETMDAYHYSTIKNNLYNLFVLLVSVVERKPNFSPLLSTPKPNVNWYLFLNKMPASTPALYVSIALSVPTLCCIAFSPAFSVLNYCDGPPLSSTKNE